MKIIDARTTTSAGQVAAGQFFGVVALCLFWANLSLAQYPGSWQALPDMPVGKWEPGTVVLDDKL